MMTFIFIYIAVCKRQILSYTIIQRCTMNEKPIDDRYSSSRPTERHEEGGGGKGEGHFFTITPQKIQHTAEDIISEQFSHFSTDIRSPGLMYAARSREQVVTYLFMYVARCTGAVGVLSRGAQQRSKRAGKIDTCKAYIRHY